MRVPDFLSAKTLKPVVPVLPIPKEYIFSKWLPLADVATDDILFHQVYDENPMAPFVTIDAEVPKSQEELLQQISANIAFIRERHEFKESDFRLFQGPVSATEGVLSRMQAEARRKLLRHVAKLRGAIDARLEWLRVNAILGTISYQAEDIKYTVTFDGINTFTATTLWSDAAATVINDLNVWIEEIANTSGVTPTTLIISNTVNLDLTRNTEIQNAWVNTQGAGGTSPTLGSAMVREVLRQHLGLNIIVYNARTTSRTYGGDTGTEIVINQNRLLATRSALLLPEEPLGELMTSPGPPDLTDSSGLYTWDYQTPKPPYVHEVGVGINVFPALYNPYKIGVLNV